MCVIDRHDMTLAVKVALNPNTIDLTTLKNKHFENIEGKGEDAGNQHFLLFPQCFLPFPEQISIFQPYLFRRLQLLSNSTSLKTCHLGKSSEGFLGSSPKLCQYLSKD